MTEIVIVSAARTPVGTFNGAFATTPAHRLGSIAISEALRRSGVAPEEIDEVILGQVLSAGQGQNPARQAAIAAGLPIETTAWGVNQLCGSGLRAVALGMQQIASGDAHIIVAGGQENMTLSPHAAYLRAGQKIGALSFADTMVTDGLWDAFNDFHMGTTAENIAARWDVTREQQDIFAVASQNKAEAAQTEGRFIEEIAPVLVSSRKGDVIVEQDEHIRKAATVEGMTGLKPSFQKNGTVTAGNASGINDGAAALVLMTASHAAQRGLIPMARIVSWATTGVDPAVMGTGPIPASRKALDKAGWTVADLDLVEANEAFAAQACVVNHEMGWDPAIVNVNGGAIALGHPIGASGARVLVTLLHEMRRRDSRRALATLCIGGGMGIAMTLER